jgi:hypothetical protein
MLTSSLTEAAPSTARSAVLALTLVLALAATAHAQPPATQPGAAQTLPAQPAAAAQTSPAQTPPAQAAGYSAEVLYNRGNSYARAGKPGLAVLNYERASLLAPGDPDIEANLRYVRESVKLPLPSRSWIDRAVSRANPTAAAGLGVLGLVMVGASLLAGRLYSRYSLLRHMTSVIGIALIAFTVRQGMLLWPTLHGAVVIKDTAPALVSPVPMGDALFVLPGAETVVITAEREGFFLIRTQSGRTGWVSRANVAPVVP